MATETGERVASRLRALGVSAPDQAVALAAAYYDLLFKWNRSVNLTSLADGDEAVDRLVAEPMVAATGLPAVGTLVDVGSGGGSPAIPLKLMRPGLHLTMIESRSRKAAFLREVVRSLELVSVTVEACRVEQWAERSRIESEPVVISMRAVRMDEALAGALASVTPPGAHLWFFGTSAGAGTFRQWQVEERRVLMADRGSVLTVYCRVC